MSLQLFLKEAAKRGERIKEKLIEDLLHSEFVNQLLKNKLFVEGIVSILNAKSSLEKTLHHKISALLKVFEIPTGESLQGIERKIHRLENEIEGLHRRVSSQNLKKKTGSKTRPFSKKAKK